MSSPLTKGGVGGGFRSGREVIEHCWTTERQPQTRVCQPRSAIFNVTAWGHSISPKRLYPLALPSITELALDAPFCKHSHIKGTIGPWRG